MPDKIKVLVVDDSAYMRQVLTNLLQSDQQITVVCMARDGIEAIEKTKELRPDVVTLDVEMPRMDGLTALQKIMAEIPTPVLMVSSLTQASSETTVQALGLGAVDFVAKPSGTISLDIYKVRDELIAKVKICARATLRNLTRNFAELKAAPVPGKTGPVLKDIAVAAAPSKTVVAIGCSTGGPGALQQIIPKLPGDLQAGVLIVQHMPPGFTKSLAQRLNEISPLQVQEAAEGDLIVNGKAFIAPGGRHMVVKPGGIIGLSDDPPVHSVRPAVDVTMESVVKVFGGNVVGVILTGMGFDGAKGMARIKNEGGLTIAQDEATCVVYGMPKVVVEAGKADRVIPLGEIAQAIVYMLGKKGGNN